MASSQLLSKKRFQYSTVFLIVALLLLIIATARPYVPKEDAESMRGTTDVVTLVDVSRSMAAEDYQGKFALKNFNTGMRLDMARYLTVTNLLQEIQGNQVGMVIYAGDAVPQSFLTDDIPSLKWVVENWVSISSAPGDGSSISKAFNLAFQLFDLDSVPTHRKIIVLFSDGGDDESPEAIDEIVQALKQRNIELIVVGLGKETPARIPVKNLSKLDEYVNQLRFRGREWYEVNGEIIKSSIDSRLLRHIANRAGGTYQQIENPRDFSFKTLLDLETIRKPGIKEVFVYPLFGALVCSFTAVWLVRKRKVKPQKSNTVVAK